jgi:hypothetical protein
MMTASKRVKERQIGRSNERKEKKEWDMNK